MTDELIDRVHFIQVAQLRRYADICRAADPATDGKEFGSGFACFAGDGSPITQAFGLGHRDSAADLRDLDRFYEGIATNWELALTPFTNPSVVQQAAELGYVPAQFESVLAQTAPVIDVEELPGMEIVDASGDLATWARVSEAGWAGRDELHEEISGLGRVMMSGRETRRYLALVDGEPAAAAGMGVVDGSFSFAGAATLPKFRGRGLQRALARRRLADAGPGSLVQVVALPGSASHRNAQRCGFQPLYSNLQLLRYCPR